MEIEAEIFKKRELQSLILDFIEIDSDDGDVFQSLIQFIEKKDISKNKEDLLDLLHIILNISRNHQRNDAFFPRIIKIIKYLLPSIQTFFTNLDIHNIFQENLILIHYFILNKILAIDQDIINLFLRIDYKYRTGFIQHRERKFNFSIDKFPYKNLFFYLHFKLLNDEKQYKKIEEEIEKEFGLGIETFQKYCLRGENESYLCQLIRQDSINDFISYVSKHEIELDSNVNYSNFETNTFLKANDAKLIEYAAFFGSIQIFKYLLMNKVSIQPILYQFAVHGKNSEIIHIVEEQVYKFKKESPIYRKKGKYNKYIFEERNSNEFDPIDALFESVKCFHNEIAEYIKETNYDDIKEDYLNHVCMQSLLCYNYQFIPSDFASFLSLKDAYLFKNGNTPSQKKEFSNIYKAFYKIPKITFSPTVKEISAHAFKDFNFKEVTLSSSMTSISANMFENCLSLIKISIPSSITSIGDYAFKGCSSLKTVEISSSLSSIGKDAFEECSSLTEISIPPSVTSIKYKTFFECSSLEEIIIPSSVTLIERYAFYKCTSLKKISVLSSVSEIKAFAFDQCSSLEEVIIDSTSLDTISEYAFYNCCSLKKIILPSSIKSIEEFAFSGCSLLEQIEIPSSVTSIEQYAFYKCSSLTHIEIPSSVTEIQKHCFKNCSSLKRILIPSSITCIRIGAFEGCSSLEVIEIPSSVKEIEDFLFSDCSSLKKIIINSKITSIKYCFFKGCSSLVEFDIPPSVTEIKENAFKECASLKQITIPSCLTSIVNHCFEGCSSLIELVIPPSITSIGNCSFKDCSSLT